MRCGECHGNHPITDKEVESRRREDIKPATEGDAWSAVNEGDDSKEEAAVAREAVVREKGRAT